MGQINIDFNGPFAVESRDKALTLLVGVCDVSAYLWVKPLAKKDKAVEAVADIIDEVNCHDSKVIDEKVVLRIRSDNEPTLKSAKWNEMLTKRGVTETHSTPYLPQQNGVVERMMRTVGDSLRAILNGVDRRTWAWAAEYMAYTWNRLPKNEYARFAAGNGLSPLEIREMCRTVDRQSIRGEGSKIFPPYAHY